MSDHPILRAAAVLPTDQALGIAAQLKKLDGLIGELEAMEPGAPPAAAKLHESHCLAGPLYHEASGHSNGANVAGWYLSMVQSLNTLAARHGLDQAPMPFHLD